MMSGVKKTAKGVLKLALPKGWRYDYALQRIRFIKDNYWQKALSEQFDQQYDGYQGTGLPEKAKAKRDCWLCWLLLGADPGDYFDFEFFRKGWGWRQHHVTLERITLMNPIFNAKENWHVFDDKLNFYSRWSDFLDRPWCVPQETSFEAFERLFTGVERLIVKPSVSYGGKGIYTVELDDMRAVYERLHEEKDPIVAEAFLKQTGFLHDVFPNAVNILRVTTLRLPDNHIDVVYGFFTAGTGKRVIANDVSGGICFPINLNTGRLGCGQGAVSNGHSAHPDTGVQVEGKCVPRWDEVKAYACRAHEHAPENIRMIGWDICVSEDNMCIIEGNTFPGFPELPDPKEDLWKRMKGYLDEWEKESSNVSKSGQSVEDQAV